MTRTFARRSRSLPSSTVPSWYRTRVWFSAARYIDAVSDHLELPLGLGSRHVAAASVSSRTDAVSVAVSESSTVRMFDDGELVAEIVPELWILGGYGSYLDGSRMGRETRRTTL